MADWAAVISCVVAAIALVIAAMEIASIRRRDRQDERVAIEGVSVSWNVVEDQDSPNADGMVQPMYEFTIQNPGRLPIDNVKAVVQLGTTVQRVRYSGNLGAPTDTLTFNVPVLPGGGERKKMRRLKLPFHERANLRHMSGQVTFRDIEGNKQINTWPRA